MFLFALGAVVSALAKQVRGQSGFLRAVELDPHQVARAIAFARREIEEGLNRSIAICNARSEYSTDVLRYHDAALCRLLRDAQELKSLEEGWITGTPETLEQLQKISALAKQGQPEAAGQMLLALIPLWGSTLGLGYFEPLGPPYSSFEGGRLWNWTSEASTGRGGLDNIARDDEAVELAGLSEQYTDEHAASDALRYAVVAGGHPTIAHLSPQSIYMAVAATLTAHVLWASTPTRPGWAASASRPLRGFGDEDRLLLFYDWVEEARSSATSPSGSIG